MNDNKIMSAIPESAHKMYFNTGVIRANRLDKDGNVILMPYQVFKGGVMQVIYFLERKPEDNLTLKYLVPEDYIPHMQENEIAIRGGMLSDYAIFRTN